MNEQANGEGLPPCLDCGHDFTWHGSDEGCDRCDCRKSHEDIYNSAALARVEALAEAMGSVPDYTASDYDRGRVDQRHMDAADLYSALHPDLSVASRAARRTE